MPARTTALVASALLVLTAPVSADPGTETHVDSVAAALTGSVLSVSGEATFVDVPVQIATDPAGDATIPAGGVDLLAATIERPSPTTSSLRFTMKIGDAIPAVFGVPEAVHYSFFFGVGQDGNDAQFLLQSLRTAAANQPSANPMFRLLRFNGTSCCTPVASVPGTMTGDEITWTAPLSQMGLQPGSTITGHPVGTRQIQIQLGASGVQWLNNGQPDFMFIDTEYEVPGPSVTIGVAPAGTPVDEVPLTASATVSGGSSFVGAIPAPGPGSYVVVAKACYTSTSCGVSSTTIDVT